MQSEYVLKPSGLFCRNISGSGPAATWITPGIAEESRWMITLQIAFPAVNVADAPSTRVSAAIVEE